jgi:hypothetical protein
LKIWEVFEEKRKQKRENVENQKLKEWQTEFILKESAQ